MKLKDFNVYFFNLYDIKTGKYSDYTALGSICKELSLNCVPLITTEYVLTNSILELELFATIKSQINPDSWAEGIVIRPLIETEDKEFMNLLNYNRVSFKVINKGYLIQNDEA